MSEVVCGQTELRRAEGSGSGPPLRGLRSHGKPKETEREKREIYNYSGGGLAEATYSRETNLTNKHKLSHSKSFLTGVK